MGDKIKNCFECKYLIAVEDGWFCNKKGLLRFHFTDTPDLEICEHAKKRGVE